MDQHIAAAADIAGAGQGDRLGEGDGDGGVHGVAALAQDVHADARGQIALAGDHAAASNNGAVNLAITNDIAAAASAGMDNGASNLGLSWPGQQHY
ncbi:hypothetical protein GCM10009081_30910 [Brevundimonas nasdae]